MEKTKLCPLIKHFPEIYPETQKKPKTRPSRKNSEVVTLLHTAQACWMLSFIV